MALHHLLRQRLVYFACTAILATTILTIYNLRQSHPRVPNVEQSRRVIDGHLLATGSQFVTGSSQPHRLEADRIGKNLLSSEDEMTEPSVVRGQSEIADRLLRYIQQEAGRDRRNESRERGEEEDLSSLNEGQLLEEWNDDLHAQEDVVRSILETEEQEYDEDYQHYMPQDVISNEPLAVGRHEDPNHLAIDWLNDQENWIGGRKKQLKPEIDLKSLVLDQDSWMDERKELLERRNPPVHRPGAVRQNWVHSNEEGDQAAPRKHHVYVRQKVVSKKLEYKRPSVRVNHDLSQRDTSIRKKRALSRQKMTLTDDQLRLRAFPLNANKDLITERHFATWKTTEALGKHLPVLEAAVNHSYTIGDWGTRELVDHSMNADIIARGLFQQAGLSNFCNKKQLSKSLPSKETDLDCLLQHLLYDDSTRMVFCYIPKNGCSNMKRMMLILNGILPPDSASRKRPAEAVLKRVKSLHNLPAEDILYRLNNYFKVVIARNPLERLLSAYRNKIEPPFDPSNRHLFPDNLKWYILQRSRKGSLSTDLRSGNISKYLHPNFHEFMHFMTMFDLSTYNEHFKPVLELCFPCAVHYDVFLNFKSLDYDVYALMDYLSIPMSYYPQTGSHSTQDYMKSYYSSLSDSEKLRMFEAFSKEIDFYYSIQPEERHMHKHL